MAAAPCVVLGLVAIFMLPVADAVCLAIGPGLFQGFKLLPQHGNYEKTALGTHFKAQREPT